MKLKNVNVTQPELRQIYLPKSDNSRVEKTSIEMEKYLFTRTLLSSRFNSPPAK